MDVCSQQISTLLKQTVNPQQDRPHPLPAPGARHATCLLSGPWLCSFVFKELGPAQGSGIKEMSITERKE